jgi:poly-gamma-glutamate synthesis protein (capsule biosynthesis protein)
VKNRSRFRAAFFLGFCALLLFSCRTVTPVDGVMINSGKEFATEHEFLVKLFSQPNFQKTLGLRLASASPALIVEFTASWTKPEGIPVSKTWYVPKEDPLAGRTSTSLAACLDGSETLVTIGEIAPPYTGLLVDALCVTDENYPLVKYVSIRIKEAQSGGEKNSRLSEKIAALEKTLAETHKPLVRDAPSIVWICAAGDLMLGRGAGDILIKEGARGIFGKTADYFKRSDLNIVNLEGAISNSGARVIKSYNFRFDPLTVPPLKAAGINAVLLANNHAFDFGETAFLDTLKHLEENGIAVLGAGRNIHAAAAPFVFTKEKHEIRIFGIASYPTESSGWSGASVSATADKAGMIFGRSGADRLKENFGRKDGVLNVIFFHGGNEWTWEPDDSTRSFYRELARSGADLIIGSHPHTVQGFEWLEGKPVFWSLGNYVFSGMDGTDGGEEGLLIRLGYAGKTLVYFEPVPVQLKGPRSELGTAEQLIFFYTLSRELKMYYN